METVRNGQIAGLRLALNADGTMRRPAVQVLRTDSGDSRVVGSVAGIAANTNTFIVFDLGEDWSQYPVATVGVHDFTASAGAVMFGRWSSDGSLAGVTSSVVLNSSTGYGDMYGGIAGGHTLANVRVMNRFLRFQVNNGATPQGTSGRAVLAIFLS